jgi:RNA-dependent RNA polymerase
MQEIQKHFVNYMINDTLGAISTAHLIHADRNPLKARSPECLQLAALHSMAVDFAKSGAPAEMPQALRPREYPDFMERWEKPMYISNGPMGKLYRAALRHAENLEALLPKEPPSWAYDPDLEVPGFHELLDAAEECYELYAEKLGTLMTYYSVEAESEILTGNILNKQLYLKRDNSRYYEMKVRILAAVDALHDEVRGWLRERREDDASRMASAWYHVTYHPDRRGGKQLWSFPWIACDNLLAIKESRSCRRSRPDGLRRLMRTAAPVKRPRAQDAGGSSSLPP